MTTTDTPRDGDERFDVVVVGGGAAGLSGALALARARRSVLVIDAGRPRTAPASAIHNYLGREGTPPSELLAIGREEVTGYGGEIRQGEVVAAERLEEGDFRLTLADGSSVLARRLLVTTGLVDELPEVQGIAERWGRDVLHCPYCHGWEARDQRIAVLGTGPMAVHQTLLWRQWSDRVTLLQHTAPDLDAEQAEQLAARDVTVVGGKVSGLEVTGDRLTGLTMADGRVIACDALVVATQVAARAGLLEGLGLGTVEQEMLGHTVGVHVPADPMGATEVPGVWVAGNVTSLVDVVIVAAAAGLRSASAINADLVAEDTRLAVAARRENQEFWDSHYGARPQVWSGDPNAILVREVADLKPGTALDLGCGEGADAVWLAGRGWRVTAVDISGVALDRAAGHAERAGVADRVDWQRHDLGASFPEGVFDLVSASFLHSYGDMPRERILRTAASAVAPGGVLLVTGHAGWASWHQDPPAGVHFPTPQEVLQSLDPEDGEWEVLLCEEHERVQNGPDGEPGTRTDNVLKIRRLR